MRRRKGILEELVELPWWMSFVAAGIVYAAARWLAPLLAGEHWFGKMLATGFSSAAPIIAALFLIPAPFAALREWRDRRRLAATRDWNAVRQMPWHEFETLLATAYRRLGYEVEVRGGGGADGGVDLVLKEEGKTTLVQCKHWNRQQVGPGVVRDLYGVMNDEAAEAGIIVTGGAFTEDAQAFARGKTIELVDGPKLEKLLSYARGEEGAQAEEAGCPKCGAAMVLRTAKRGTSAGSRFWGCSRWPECDGKRASA